MKAAKTAFKGARMDERAVEKRVCKILWDVFHDYMDGLPVSTTIWPLWDLQDKLTEAMPYGPEEVH